MTTTPSEQLHIETPLGKLSYHVVGDGPALFLLHGSGPGVTGMENFQGNLDWYAASFRTYVPDLPGYGASDAIPGPADRAPEAILGMMDALGIEQAAFIGNSYGGNVVARFAAAYPDRVTRIVMIGGVGYNIVSPFPNEGINLLTEFVEDPTRERLRQWLHSMVYDPAIVTEEMIDRRLAQALDPATCETTYNKYSKRALQGISQGGRGAAGLARVEFLGRISCPSLLTWGRDDRVSQLDRALIPLQVIPNCQLHVFPRCGHWVMIEAKEAFEAVTMAFLRQS